MPKKNPHEDRAGARSEVLDVMREQNELLERMTSLLLEISLDMRALRYATQPPTKERVLRDWPIFVTNLRKWNGEIIGEKRNGS